MACLWPNHLPSITSSGGYDVSFKEGMIAYCPSNREVDTSRTSGFDKNHREDEFVSGTRVCLPATWMSQEVSI